MTTMETVLEQDIENGMRVDILLNHTGNKFDGQFHVRLIDVDANEVVTAVICPSVELAHKYAAKFGARV